MTSRGGGEGDTRDRLGFDPARVLHRLAVTASRAGGFGAVTVNLRRPDGAYEVVADTGGELLGTRTPDGFWGALQEDGHSLGNAYIVAPEHVRRTMEAYPEVRSVVPDLPPAAEPGDWDPDHMLVVPMRSRGGDTIGYFSVDCPLGGRIPGPELVADMETFAEHAALTVELGAEAEALRASEERFRSLVQNSTDVIAVLDARGATRYVSPAVERVLGYTPDERVGTSVFDAGLVHPEDSARVRDAFAEIVARPGAELRIQLRLRHRDGSWRHAEAVGRNLLDDPSVGGVVVNYRDVTERREAEEALRSSEAGLAKAQRIAHLGSWEWELATGRVRWSEEAGRIYGFAPEESLRTYDEFLACVHPEDRDAVAASDRATLRASRPYDLEFRVVRPDGAVRVVQERAEVVRGEDGAPVRMVGTVLDITERKALEELLRHRALHDPLTGLPNRALFMDRLDHALARTARHRSTASVLYLDVDRLKRVNDSLGHDAGDGLLVAIAERLRGSVRPEDTVARLSGDEFAVLVEDIGDPGEAASVAECILGALAAPFVVSGREVVATASIGVVGGGSAEETTPAALLRAADAAMYRAKVAGGSRYAVYDPCMGPRALERLELEAELRRAIARGELEVHYQPKVGLRTGRIAEVEALVRWRHPTRGLLPPSAFIGLAEETGLIVPIGRWVLLEACRRVRAWRDRYPSDPPLRADVNLSAREFAHPEIVGEVARILRESGLDAGGLELEITEGVVMAEGEAVAATLRELDGLGVLLAIDDFGTGYSSLAHLKRFPISTLKIDREFVAGLDRDPEDTAIVGAVLGLGRALGLHVVAEGVETAEQLAALRVLGCELVQGNYTSRPLPEGEMDALLSGGKPLISGDRS